jgi:hypothetical protein
MRAILAVFGSLFLISGTVRAEVVFTEPAVELGELRTGQTFPRALTFVNRGNGPVEIKAVKGSCACLAAACPAGQVPAGGQGTVQLTVNTLSASPGPQAWRVTLRYVENGAEQEAAAVLRAKVVQEIIVQPPQILVFADGATQHEITVTDLRGKPLRVIKAEATSPHLRPAVFQEHDEGGRRVQAVKLAIAKEMPVGRHDEQVTLFTDDPVYKELKVQVSVVRKGQHRYSVLPGAVALAADAGQPSPARMVTVRDRQGQAVVIDRATADHPAIQCQWSPGANTVGTVKITVDRAKMDGPVLNGKVQIYLHPSGECVTVPVVCEKQ